MSDPHGEPEQRDVDEAYGERIAPDTVRFRRLLPGPLDRVWAYLTDSELRGTWFASGPLEPRVGGTLTLHFRHADLMHPDETPPPKYADLAAKAFTNVAEVTRYEPPNVLAFLWDDTEVEITLAPRGDDVLLTLTHRRLATRKGLVDVSAGWHAHLGVLEQRLRGTEPQPFWPRLERFDREYAERIS